jgi:hypothetical protein
MGCVMFDELKATFRSLCDRQFRLWAGMAFMALALASIQYDEIIAPGVGRISEAWNAAASDFSRSLASFAS